MYVPVNGAWRNGSISFRRGREEHGLPIRVARGTATVPARPRAALRLPVFSPLSLCRVRSMGVRRSPSPFDGTQPSIAKRCIYASFRQCKSALNSVFCINRRYNRKNLYLRSVIIVVFCIMCKRNKPRKYSLVWV